MSVKGVSAQVHSRAYAVMHSGSMPVADDALGHVSSHRRLRAARSNFSLLKGALLALLNNSRSSAFETPDVSSHIVLFLLKLRPKSTPSLWVATFHLICPLPI